MHTIRGHVIVIIGTILALTQVVGVPFMWKQWLSAGVGLLLIGLGLYIRYGHGTIDTKAHE